jgi:Ca-activated chloride channel homolog
MMLPLLALGFLLAQFASGISLVEVYATVTDDRGRLRKDLTAADFTVYEDGAPQRISTFVAGDAPLSVALAIDRSFSMAGVRLDLAKAAGRAFLQELGPSDRALVLAVGSEVEILTPLSADREAHLQAVSQLQPWGATPLHDAIIESLRLIQPAGGRRALIVLSDGDDLESRATEVDVLEQARRSDVLIYPVALGRSRPEMFAQLAVTTGGRSFHLADPRRLEETLRSIADELRHQYLLGYTPARPAVAGERQWRTIEVRTSDPRLQVRARDGYFAH